MTPDAVRLHDHDKAETRPIITTVAAAGFLAGGMFLAGPAVTAEAGGSTPHHTMGPYTSLSKCKAASRPYNTSFTRVSQACTNYPESAFTQPGNSGYYFHYKARTR